MAEFEEIGAFWLPRPGAKSSLSGVLDAVAVDRVLRECPQEDKIRIFIQKNKSASDRAPAYRLVAVFGEDTDARGRASRDYREREPRRERDDNRREERPKREGSRREEPQKNPFEATDEDVPF